jgi:DNA-binding XRE family transcriptional regulator
MIYKDFAKLIKKKRDELGLTQQEMAKMIPTHKSTYCKIENGLQEPNFIILQRICTLLQIDITKELKILDKVSKNYYLYD